MEAEFLGLDEILALHADQIRRYGGRRGIRDMGLLQSAAATAETTYEGELLHTTLFEMAAAYLFHIVKNHPFVDGNKRTGLMAAITFLWLNDTSLEAEPGAVTKLVMGVAAGSVSKAEVAIFLRDHLRPRM